MKRAVIPVNFPITKSNEAIEASFELADPGEICDCIIAVRQATGGIITAAEAAGKPQYEFIPTMMVSIDPAAPTRSRNFIAVPPMREVESDGQLVYRGRFLFPDGGFLILFEEVNVTNTSK